MRTSQNRQAVEGLKRMRKILTEYAAGMAVTAFLLYMAHSDCLNGCSSTRSAWVSAVGLSALLLLSANTVFRLIRSDPISIWTPPVLYAAATGLFFGFGPMSLLFGNEATRLYLTTGHYAIDTDDVVRTTLLTSMGVTTCLFGMIIAMGSQVRDSRKRMSRRPLSVSTIAIIFYIGGVALKYGLVLPAQFGIINIVVPGTLVNMASVLYLGLAIMAYLAMQGRKTWRLLFWILWPIHFALTTIEFSKETLVLAVVLPAAGAFLAHHNWRRLVPWLAVAAIAFAFAQNVNTAARSEILDRTGTISKASFRERAEILSSVLTGKIELSEATRTDVVDSFELFTRANPSHGTL